MGHNVVLGVSEKTKPGTEAGRREWWWAEGSIWTERMVSALATASKEAIGHPPNAFFAAHGLFTLTAAHAQARHSR